MTRNELLIELSKLGLSGSIINGTFDRLLTDPIPAKPYSRYIAIYGDSRTAMCHTVAATAIATENYGYAFWACASTGLAFCPYTYNFGYGGDTTAMMLARIGAVVACPADIVLFMGGTNDRTGGMSVADTKRNILAIVRRLTRAGKTVIVGNDTPRFGAKALTAQQQKDHETIRDWILTDLSKLTPVVDTYSLITPADLNDELHPNVLGAAKLGMKAFGPALANYLKIPTDLPLEAADTYSATSTTGSLIANPLMIGSGSMTTSSVNPVAGGVITTGYKAAGSAFTGVTTTWSKVPVQFGEAQLIKFGGTPTAVNAYLAYSPLATFNQANLAVGDVISLMCGADILNSGLGILGVVAELVVTKPVGGTSTTLYYRDGDKYQEPFIMPNGPYSVSLDTPRYTVDGTETSIVPRISIYLSQNVAQTGSVQLRQMAVRKHVA